MILAILQARMSSTRLPGKVMRPILGKPMVFRQIERLSRARRIDRLVLATSVEPSDDGLAAACGEQGIAVWRGPLDDTLTRFTGAEAAFGPAAHIVRLTADCPLADWAVIDACIDLHLGGGFDFTSNAMRRSYPVGLDVEVMTADLLRIFDQQSSTPYRREHVTQLVYDEPDAFRCGHLVQEIDESNERWTVDTPADFAMATAVYEALLPGNPRFTSDDVRDLLRRRPDIVALNRPSADGS